MSCLWELVEKWESRLGISRDDHSELGYFGSSWAKIVCAATDHDRVIPYPYYAFQLWTVYLYLCLWWYQYGNQTNQLFWLQICRNSWNESILIKVCMFLFELNLVYILHQFMSQSLNFSLQKEELANWVPKSPKCMYGPINPNEILGLFFIYFEVETISGVVDREKDTDTITNDKHNTGKTLWLIWRQATWLVAFLFFLSLAPLVSLFVNANQLNTSGGLAVVDGHRRFSALKSPKPAWYYMDERPRLLSNSMPLELSKEVCFFEISEAYATYFTRISTFLLGWSYWNCFIMCTSKLCVLTNEAKFRSANNSVILVNDHDLVNCFFKFRVRLISFAKTLQISESFFFIIIIVSNQHLC